MHTKLDLRVYGANASSDWEIIEENLKSQNAIKNLKMLSSKGYIGIKMDIEENKITGQQVLDIINLSGDFKVEEQIENKPSVKTVVPKKEIAREADKAKEIDKVIDVQSSRMMAVSSNQDIWSAASSKTFFIWGVLGGVAAISLILSIVFGYRLFFSSVTGGNSFQNYVTKQGEQVAQNVPAPRPQAPAQPSPVAAQVQNFDIKRDDNVRGNFNAPITLVEYSDFECPFCGRIYPTFKKLLADYPNKVRLVYKYFPLSFHPNAQKAAEAAQCAAEQGKFWEYHDKLFEEQAGGFSLSNFKQWADDLDLNIKKFNSCLDSDKYASKVQAEEADGQNRGVQGTPATFVNGQLVSGALPYESFKSIIDQILTNK